MPSNNLENVSFAIGLNFGSYHIKRVLGEGAFGTVFEAIKEPLGKRVAIKILHAKWTENEHVAERFIAEARAAASLRHPHIVDVDDVGSTNGVMWIAMEFLEGESLADRLSRDGPMPLQLALKYMLPIVSAVAAIHDKGIIHRDLKPENIQLWRGSTGNVHPKLLDFGIAKQKIEVGANAITGPREIMGTPEYMSPEQWKNSSFIQPNSDQWALAVILYRLITGVSPFLAATVYSIMFRVSAEPAPPFGSHLAQHSAFEAVLAVALRKNPADRYASVRAFGAALCQFADDGVRQHWQAEFGGASAVIEGGASFNGSEVHADTINSTGWMKSTSGAASVPLTSSSADRLDPKPRRTAVIAVTATLAVVGLLSGIVRLASPTGLVPQSGRQTAPGAAILPAVHQSSQPAMASTNSIVGAQDLPRPPSSQTGARVGATANTAAVPLLVVATPATTAPTPQPATAASPLRSATSGHRNTARRTPVNAVLLYNSLSTPNL